MRKCKLCELKNKIEVISVSYTKGTMQLIEPNVLSVKTNDEKEVYNYIINNCPLCGKKI